MMGKGHTPNTHSPGCCPSGTQCFKQNNYYAQCLATCPTGSDWDCTILGVNPPSPAPPLDPSCSQVVAKYGACTNAPLCCGGGLTCFEKNKYYAQCLVTCPTSEWTCRDLGTTGSR
eukprot:TRINITY_DN7951_c0_g1_i12.p2 TRINITY_DN7951_c0_g1~~TRINITY_DN7951_c0_g1_i12.p2  ORF type:complete len:116 (+),score=37.85 TRINITY_DN7951_c0_g1_i12:162-509(+)